MSATRAAIVTGPSPGAIGVIRVVGPGAIAAVSAHFKPNQGSNLRHGNPASPRFGRMGSGEGDEVVVLVADESEVEIHAHGGPAALASVLDDLRAEGVAVDPPGAGSELDGLLARAATIRVADILLDQSGGAFDLEKERLEALARTDRAAANAEALALLELARFGQCLDRGWSIVLSGRPNVGKSRLLNAIAGFDRAIVSPVAGTTRDVVTARVAIDGWPVDLSDTAGVHASAWGVEASGIALANEVRARSDLVIIVLDRSCDRTDDDDMLVKSSPGALIVANKSDLPAAWCAAEISSLAVSAVTGDGILELLAAISARIVPVPPAPGAVVPLLGDEVAWLRTFAIDSAATSSRPGPEGRD